MNIQKFFLDFLMIFALVFVVTVIVSYLYSLLAHGAGDFDWDGGVRLGIIIGVALTWVNSRKK